MLATALAAACAVCVLGASLATAADVPTTGSASVARGGGCRGADKPAASTSSHKLRKSIRCLINRERAVHGFGKLAHRHALEKAGQRHAKTMVATGCLAHRCPGEIDLEGRLRAGRLLRRSVLVALRREHRVRGERRGDGRRMA